MRYILILIVAMLVSCMLERDDRTIASYRLVYCDARKPEQVYCDGTFVYLDNYKRSVPEFKCSGLDGSNIVKLNVCDTVCIARSVN
jgi:hypothetical protein